ncbi:MAG: uracil-DNA glycosylase family protein [Opitutaceae bacterium]
MRTALTILADELRRLKATGVKSVSVSDESIAILRRGIAARAEKGSTSGKIPPAGGTPSTRCSPDQPPGEGTRPTPNPKPVSAPPATSTLPASPVVALLAGDKVTRWNALRELVGNDPVCRSHVRPGKKIVLGVGNLDAKIMFVGEAPGAEEELQGEPFVGPAGQLLTKMIGAMGLARGDVYIGNIMNWRPELPTAEGATQVGNRAPNEEEMRYCLPYLRAQIEVVQPALLVALGATAAQGLLGFGSFKALGDIRGQWRDFSGTPLLITYHPSYILRSQSNRSKRMIWEDLLKVMERAALPISEKQRGYFLEK